MSSRAHIWWVSGKAGRVEVRVAGKRGLGQARLAEDGRSSFYADAGCPFSQTSRGVRSIEEFGVLHVKAVGENLAGMAIESPFDLEEF